MFPIAPSSFMKRLRAFDPALSVRFDPSTGGWQIFQGMKQWVDQGCFSGGRLIILKTVPVYVGHVQGLGYSTFATLRRSSMVRYGRSGVRNTMYNDFCKEWNVRTA